MITKLMLLTTNNSLILAENTRWNLKMLYKLCMSNIERYGSGISRIKTKFEEFVHGFRVIVYKEKLDVGVSEGVKSLYELIKNKPNNRSTFFAKELNTSVKNIERWLKQLKDENKIEFKGSPKTGGYVVR